MFQKAAAFDTLIIVDLQLTRLWAWKKKEDIKLNEIWLLHALAPPLTLLLRLLVLHTNMHIIP